MGLGLEIELTAHSQVVGNWSGGEGSFQRLKGPDRAGELVSVTLEGPRQGPVALFTVRDSHEDVLANEGLMVVHWTKSGGASGMRRSAAAGTLRITPS